MEGQAADNLNPESGKGGVGEAVIKSIAKSSRTTDNESKAYHFEYTTNHFFWHKSYDSIRRTWTSLTFHMDLYPYKVPFSLKYS